MSIVQLHDLPGSPNSMKVRVALGYKGIPYEQHSIDGSDESRRALVELSGQPLAPAIRHGDTVLCDSSAIVRYLDCNFRDTPPLLFEDRDSLREAEQLEKWAKGPLAAPVGIVFGEVFSEQPNLDRCREATRMLNEATAEIESRLEGAEWLVGGRISLADVTAAPFALLGMLPEQAEAMHPAVAFFRANLVMGEGRDRTRAWVGRVVSHDRMLAPSA